MIKKITIAIVLLSVCLLSFGQTRQEKTDSIIKKYNLIESIQSNYSFQMDFIKFHATGNDSIRIFALDDKLSDQAINILISNSFEEIFTNKEIDDLYYFIKSSAFQKFFVTDDLDSALSTQFIDIDKEIDDIYNNMDYIDDYEQTYEAERIYVDRENGFYLAVDYNEAINDEDIVLEDKPSMTVKDIKEVTKAYDSHFPEISIVFTKKGTKKFHKMTKENIGGPIAIVIDKHIISMPFIQSPISGGKVVISGNFTEQEVDDIVKALKGK